VKALVIAPSGTEAQPWLDKLALSDAVDVPGLSSAFPTVRCNGDGVCLLVTGPGKAAGSASVSAVVASPALDLSRAYILVSGLAAIDPAQGTIGTVAWAKNAVDFGIAWELDARALPAGWDTGYLGIFASSPAEKPRTSYGTEVYRLDADLVTRALSLSTSATLADDDDARATRAHYAGPPATESPRVVACDTVTSDTRWHGELLGKRAHDWTALLTGDGSYCTTQQSDNGVLAALTRGADLGRLDLKRVAVVHAASSFDRQYAGQSAYDSMLSADAHGQTIAASNLYAAGAALVSDAIKSWSADPPPPQPPADQGPRRAVKVMIVNMVFVEGVPFIDGLGLSQKIAVPGLSKTAPNVSCNADDVCEVTTGMGYANAAASITALVYSGAFDLTRTYFVIAGIAGIDPAQGTLGSAAWARYAVDFGFSREIDAREMPAGWPYGYLGFGAKSPTDNPSTDFGSVIQLDEDLLQAAYGLSKTVTLDDSDAAAKFRANFTEAPAKEPPKVIVCDISSSDTWFAGTVLNTRARDWTKLLTGSKGTYCTSAQEDNATLEVLRRGAAVGKVDMKRVAALRTASDFGAPYQGQSEVDGLTKSLEQGGLTPSTTNLFRATGPLIKAIASDWGRWQNGVPR
jgi:purine nucleoside permease